MTVKNSKSIQQLQIIHEKEPKFGSRKKQKNMYTSEPRKISKQLPVSSIAIALKQELYIHMLQDEGFNSQPKMDLIACQQQNRKKQQFDKIRLNFRKSSGLNLPIRTLQESSKLSTHASIYERKPSLFLERISVKSKSKNDKIVVDFKKNQSRKQKGLRTFKFFLQKGNNHHLVRSIFLEKFGFEETLLKGEANLLWYQWVPLSIKQQGLNGSNKASNGNSKKSIYRPVFFSQLDKKLELCQKKLQKQKCQQKALLSTALKQVQMPVQEQAPESRFTSELNGNFRSLPQNDLSNTQAKGAQFCSVKSKGFFEKLQKIQYFNCLINHSQLTNKQNLYRNLTTLSIQSANCTQKIQFLPKTYIINFKQDEKKLYQNLKQFILHFYRNELMLGNIKKPKKLTNKAAFTLKNYRIDINLDLKELYMQAFMSFQSDKKLKGINQEDNQIQQKNSKEKTQQMHVQRNMWIFKPTSLNRGRGIEMFNSLKRLESILKEDNQHICVSMYNENRLPSSFVIQEYIKNPLLIQNCKFDIRIWVLLKVVKEKDPKRNDANRKKLKLYYCREGYSRIASTQYSQNGINECNTTQAVPKQRIDTVQMVLDGDDQEPKQVFLKKDDSASIKKNNKKSLSARNNKFAHLTNIAVQKHSKDFGKIYQGNVLSISDTINYIKAKYGRPLESTKPKDNEDDHHEDKATFKQFQQFNENIVHNQLSQIVLKSIDSVKQAFMKENKPGQFQLFGYDFLFDSNLKPWLIEVNCNPSLQQSSLMLSKLLKRMLYQTGQVLFEEQEYFKKQQGVQEKDFIWQILGEYSYD